MSRKFRPRTRRLAIAEQLAWLRARWGANWTVARQGGAIVAVGKVRPDDICREYTVQVRYGGGQPKVTVIDPPLESRPDGAPIPHMYDQERLCLFHPKYRDWTQSKLLANTIIPWISEWLYFYEIWLATGEWLGGGEHPTPRASGRASSAAC